MLTIRKRQMAAFQAAQHRQFVQESLVFLQAFGTDHALDTTHVHSPAIHEAIERAFQDGLTTKSELTAYLLVDLFICKAFSESELLAEVMKDSALSPAERFEKVLFGLDDEDWDILFTAKGHEDHENP